MHNHCLLRNKARRFLVYLSSDKAMEVLFFFTSPRHSTPFHFLLHFSETLCGTFFFLAVFIGGMTCFSFLSMSGWATEENYL